MMAQQAHTLLFFRQSATGQLAAIIASVFCENIELCSPEPIRETHPLAIEVLRECDISKKHVPVIHVDEALARYRELIFIAEDGFTPSTRIDLPRGKLYEWSLPSAIVGGESHAVTLARARIVRDMLIRRFSEWCFRRKCRTRVRDHAETA